jgi:hypothetical protein
MNYKIGREKMPKEKITLCQQKIAWNVNFPAWPNIPIYFSDLIQPAPNLSGQMTYVSPLELSVWIWGNHGGRDF